MPEGLLLDRRGHTLFAVAERGEGNLFTAEMIDGLTNEIAACGRTRDVRFVRIAARGATFCLGRERAGQTAGELRNEAARIVELNETIRTSPLTIIAEVQGDAAGFGAGLAASADITVMARHASLSFPEIHGGLAPTIVLSWLIHSVPHKTAFLMTATGEPITAAEAQRLGLVTTVVDRDPPSAHVDELVEALSQKSARALREIKRFLVTAGSMEPRTAARAAVEPLVVSSMRIHEETAASQQDRSGDQ